MPPFNIKIVGGGLTSIVIQISPNRVVKCSRPGRENAVEHERRILQHLRPHPRIILGFDQEQSGELILEYHPRNLRQALELGQSIYTLKWVLQIAEGLDFIHKRGVIHHDLNPRNILISATENIVLCDFGGSSLNGKKPPGECGEIRFFPYHRNGTVQDDHFAFGSVLYEMATREMPYAELEEEQVLSLYKKMSFPSVTHIQIGSIIINCWTGHYKTTEHLFNDLVSFPLFPLNLPLLIVIFQRKAAAEETTSNSTGDASVGGYTGVMAAMVVLVMAVILAVH
jgi:serine/threonine protein kinase